MSQPDPKWYLLGIIALAFLAIQIPRWFDGPAFSQEEGLQICKDAFAKYQLLAAEKAPQEQWDAFDAEVLPKIQAFTADHEENYISINQNEPARGMIYQVAKYTLPEVIANRGSKKKLEHPGDIGRQLADAEKVMLRLTMPERPSTKPKAESKQGWDPIVIAIVLSDLGIALVGGGYWFWRS